VLTVTVKKYDRDTAKLTFISDESPEHIFYEKLQLIKSNDVLGGVVRSRYKNSIFVEISGGLVGLADYNPSLSYGDFVTVKVKRVSEDGRKIKLEILD
jgi:ribosomal protein S1